MSESVVNTWERPYFEPRGGDAVLSYVVFGNFDSAELSLDRTRYRTRGVPEECKLELRRRSDEPAWFQGFTGGSLGRMLDQQAPDIAHAVREAPACMTLLGEVSDPHSLEYLRDAVGLITHLLDHGGVGVLDAFGLQWWRPEEWRKELFEPGVPLVLRHAGILISEDEPTPEGRKAVWVHTRGMGKFGRPDISIHRVVEEQVEPSVALCNRLIILQAMGGIVPDGEPVMTAGLPTDWICRHTGHPANPEFNNFHLEIG